MKLGIFILAFVAVLLAMADFASAGKVSHFAIQLTSCSTNANDDTSQINVRNA